MKPSPSPHRAQLVIFACALLLCTAVPAAAQDKLTWRSYEPRPQPFPADSARCEGMAATTRDGPDPRSYDQCMQLAGWKLMKTVERNKANSCAPVLVRALQRDSALAPVLRAAFTRRFRPHQGLGGELQLRVRPGAGELRGEYVSPRGPASPDSVVGPVVVNVPEGDTSSPPPDFALPTLQQYVGAAEKLVQVDLGERLGGIGRSAKSRYLVSFRPLCVREFEGSRNGRPAEAATDTKGDVFYEFQVEKPAMPFPSNPSPRYPEKLKMAGTSGRVRVQFVIDTTGRPEVSTVKILESSHVLFTNAVREAVARMQFYPAETGGKKLRQLVEMPFEFSVTP